LVDIPLNAVIDQHNLNDNAMTVLLKELDLQTKSKLKSDGDTYDIFGLAEWSDKKIQSTANPAKRIVYKTNSATTQDMPLFVKASLLRKCHQMTIRTDVSDAGVYICKYWILKLLEDLEKEHDIEHTSINVTNFTIF
jgi:hypothetical protein